MLYFSQTIKRLFKIQSVHQNLLNQTAAAAAAAAAVNQSGMSTSRAGMTPMNWLGGSSLPWFHQGHSQSRDTQIPFQIPDFIKHAAQQHLAAQQVAQLKVNKPKIYIYIYFIHIFLHIYLAITQ